VKLIRTGAPKSRVSGVSWPPPPPWSWGQKLHMAFMKIDVSCYVIKHDFLPRHPRLKNGSRAPTFGPQPDHSQTPTFQRHTSKSGSARRSQSSTRWCLQHAETDAMACMFKRWKSYHIKHTGRDWRTQTGRLVGFKQPPLNFKNFFELCLQKSSSKFCSYTH